MNMFFVINLTASLIWFGARPFPLNSQVSYIPRFVKDNDTVSIQSKLQPCSIFSQYFVRDTRQFGSLHHHAMSTAATKLPSWQLSVFHCHFVIDRGTANCNDNLLCHQWKRSGNHDNSRFPVIFISLVLGLVLEGHGRLDDGLYEFLVCKRRRVCRRQHFNPMSMGETEAAFPEDWEQTDRWQTGKWRHRRPWVYITQGRLMKSHYSGLHQSTRCAYSRFQELPPLWKSNRNFFQESNLIDCVYVLNDPFKKLKVPNI